MVLRYSEAQDGQLLEEGITEAGSMGSFTAAGTAYATFGEPMIPFYIYYSMFGYQRVGDLIWAFGDSRGRGFMLGGTAGRTTLNGEGLQHQDGHSPLLFSALPNVRIYDPAYAYELAVSSATASGACHVDGEDVFYYLTALQRELRDAAQARRGGRGHPARPLPLPCLGERPHAPGHHPGQRHGHAGGAAGASTTSPRTTMSPPTSGA